MEQLLKEAELTGAASRWRGFDLANGSSKVVGFIGQLEAVRCLLDISFIEGVLSE